MKIQKKFEESQKKDKKLDIKLRMKILFQWPKFKNSSSEEEKSKIINLKDDDSTEKILFINIKNINQKNIMTINNEKINLIY